MKKIFYTISLFIIFEFLSFSYHFINKTAAQVVLCNPVTGTACTYCVTEGAGCRVDFNMSSCNIYGYSPDPSVCSNLNSGCNDGQPMGNCLESPPVCINVNWPCIGTSGTQGNCCNDLLCNNGSCVSSVCKNISETCPGPAGTQGGCCGGSICQVTAGGGLTCQDPPNPITGYFCDSVSSPCLPCHGGDLNSQCNPPEYTTYAACNGACTGQTPTRFSCDRTSGQCIENQNGNYSNIGNCATNCSSSISDPTCNNGGGINTAIGCIPINDTNEFMGWVLGWAVGIGGGIAFLLIVYASFMTMTSQGNPERLKAGQELLTSAISGLILLIFSVFILKFIGIDILKLDGFGFGSQQTTIEQPRDNIRR